jgi:hypothetical protein
LVNTAHLADEIHACKEMRQVTDTERQTLPTLSQREFHLAALEFDSPERLHLVMGETGMRRRGEALLRSVSAAWKVSVAQNIETPIRIEGTDLGCGKHEQRVLYSRHRRHSNPGASGRETHRTPA